MVRLKNIPKVENPRGSYGFFAVRHAPQKEVFYPKELSITHVAQGVRSGDCDFLSVINAILALPDGESYIRNLLIEKNGIVYVHFFKNDKPQWIAVEKSLPTSWGVLSSGALWVRFLEKAFVAFKGGDYNEVLNQSDSRTALRTMLGGFETSITLPVQARTPLSTLYQKTTHGCSGKDIHTLMLLLRPQDKMATKANLVKHVFAGDEDFLHIWWEMVTRERPSLEKFLASKPVIFEEDMIAFIEQRQEFYNKPATVTASNAVIAWIKESKILPSETHYSQDELALYEELIQAYDEQRPVVADAKQMPPIGITAEHTYAIMGFRESEISHRKFVILRNPHHENMPWFLRYFFSGGRQSHEISDKEGNVKLMIKSTGSSTFEMELHDFAHAFAYIDCGRSLKEIKLDRLEVDELPPEEVLSEALSSGSGL
ncbi:C2 family cysteine protease [Legionella feeleii]|uniref:Coiled-coil protein n=1 Tax=Legionella feeleii TaxID=453 RepID=A0A0W0TLB0_9GAMM|nr:C2 family cysteine protease [Legionella feeleii]KTC96388.1 coiled-coil protein [Legionella feeleii]SPX61939.1 coiled-coil protein [Legionella feeleii]